MISALRWLIALSVPVVLVMVSVRLVMTPLFLQIEYNRPGFPDDPYGFTRADRLHLAPLALDYLIYNQDNSALSDLRSQDGAPLYNSRELHHMRDVQRLTTTAYGLALVLGALALAGMAGLLVLARWRTRDRDGGAAPTAEALASIGAALNRGGWLTLALIVVIVTLALLGWQVFFTGFHTLFFAEGTWYFLTSDTLIRLFPEQFWFDAALTIGGFTALAAGLIVWLTRR
jgi:hypothetical protein